MQHHQDSHFQKIIIWRQNLEATLFFHLLHIISIYVNLDDAAPANNNYTCVNYKHDLIDRGKD